MASDAASPLNHFESVEEIKLKHKEDIAAVRAKLTEGQQDDDVIVYRYLRGYKFNVDKAAAALNKTLKWRAEGGLDAIRAKAKDIDQKDFPFAAQILRCHPHRIHHREDKKGQPLSLERIGHTNPALLRKLVTLEQLVAYHLYHVENKAHLAVELTQKTGRVMRMCKVLDLDGLSLRLMDPQGLSWLNHIITLSQDHYPEMMGNLYIINAPWMFKMFWNIIKPWLQPATLEKIQIFGTSDYQEKLLEAIDAESLPTWAGGKCECPEGCVVEKGEAFGFTEKMVPRKDQIVEEVEVKEKDTAVAWEFRTEKYDIGFSAFFKTASGQGIQVEELKRYDAHNEHVYGAYEAKEPGVLVLTWDNSYSRWTDKKLFFRVEQSAASSALHEAIEEQHAHSHPHQHHTS